ncbi:hypothetical protein LOTGIDRAFT_222222 [Lottia gigantea]|uniref:Small integral membrane protein 4 n=1 Tax=Lottia gigantea TaxID=225164 RepID=V3Z1I0_LOTGI|nr:hypothetical protein LOTGIDRAFT_222222 [Lottia gigantea]ESO84378.1 hypothetical protein LOTGIDRAFT_222222 [Lottia gigantea]
MVARLISRSVETIVNKWPGKKYLGVFRFLPCFVVIGAVLEFSMVNWTVREANFYTVYKKRQIRDQALAELKAEAENASGT